MSDKTNIIKNIVSSIRKYSQGTIYLFGSTLRNFLISENTTTLDVTVDEKDKDLQAKILNITIPNIVVNFIFNSEVDYSHEYYTLDNIYAVIGEDFSGNLEIQSTNNGLVDLNKKIIKLTKSGKDKVKESPQFIFDTITLIAENGFILDVGTISLFLKHKAIVKKADSRKISDFMKNIVGYEHPRKIVSLVNTLGISKELFDIKLVETSIINHLKAEDYCEFLAIAFSDVEPSDLRKVMIGFSPKDVEMTKNISEAILSIKTEDVVTARNILKIIRSNRIQGMIRLLYAMKFKTLAKLVRSQKESVFDVKKLCIDEQTIRDTFKIDDDEEVKKILDMALQKVITNPEFNDKYKILTFINKERT